MHLLVKFGRCGYKNLDFMTKSLFLMFFLRSSHYFWLASGGQICISRAEINSIIASTLSPHFFKLFVSGNFCEFLRRFCQILGLNFWADLQRYRLFIKRTLPVAIEEDCYLLVGEDDLRYAYCTPIKTTKLFTLYFAHSVVN